MRSHNHFGRAFRRARTLALSLAVAACAAGKTTTLTSNSAGAATVPMSIRIAPNAIADTVGQRTQLVVAMTDASGHSVNGCAVTWSATDTGSVQVSSTGLATAVAPGSGSVIAACRGATGVAQVNVVAKGVKPTLPPANGAEPAYASGVGTLLWQDNFDGRGTDAAMLSPYALMNGESGIHFDATGGLNGSGAARVDWPAQTAAGGCLDDAHLIERSFAPSQEVYAQYSVRYNSGFVFDWIGRSGGLGCVGNAKKLFFLWAGSGQRFDFISENHAMGMGSDQDHPLFNQNAGPVVSDEMLGDGNWHRITMHVRQSSTPTAKDGLIEGWIDGVLRWSWPNVASNASGGWVLFKMPTTFNQGSPVNQSEWFDGLTVWRP
jgi:hypothetical protein